MKLETVLKKDEGQSQPKWLSIFRIALGLILFWKGIYFIYDTPALILLIKGSGISILSNNSSLIAFSVAYLNLLGGFLIAVGLFARWSSEVQIPILLGALIVNYYSGSTSELILSIIVLILLVVFSFKGTGIISADEYFRNYYKAGKEPGHTPIG